MSVTMSEQDAMLVDVRFADQPGALLPLRHAPYRGGKCGGTGVDSDGAMAALTLLAFSLLCALVYSRYITRPIVRLSGLPARWRSWTLPGSAGRSAGRDWKAGPQFG